VSGGQKKRSDSESEGFLDFPFVAVRRDCEDCPAWFWRLRLSLGRAQTHI